ncbi:RING-H2 finger protein ATL80 [Senna tora]|uniref:RING-H2 finger protein ATL80 n=1 Tax=Senna tora TaxID=362788 RepID=A0A834WSF8_9FABA|nr:RING-H2 finger protein ATL80 [Senna tora]
MSFHRRFLGERASPSPAIDSDLLVILAALLCGLICVLGLVAVARCACLRRAPAPAAAAGANKGIKKKALRSLPKLTITPESASTYSDCAICLTDLIGGDEIRLLPQCAHAFHVSCIDKWLESHSSCPSCRQILVFSRCRKCGGSTTPPLSHDPNTFLP